MIKDYSTRAYRGYLAELALESENPHSGFFGPRSAMWRSFQEASIVLCFPRALAMQISDPAIAAGVAQHSDFPRRAVQRLYRSLVFNHTVAFGSCQEATEALIALYARHHKVRGHVMGQGAYHANQSELQRWVLLTTIDSVIYALKHFFGDRPPVSPQDFYGDTQRLLRLFRVNCQLPARADEFQDMISNEALSKEITPIAQQQFKAMLRLPSPVFWTSNRILLAGSLPEPLRKAYGLDLDPTTRLSYRAGLGILSTVTRVTPRWLRTVPIARQSKKRVKAGGPT
jgi:uncharacterized protein (DUF2236 family)